MKDAIRVSGLAKQYQLGLQHRKPPSFREMVLGTLKKPFKNLKRLRGEGNEVKNFWALHDINFEVKPGEVVGVIGRNGAGKSTLLKILSRITSPTNGEIQYIGRMASLLEVGTGFHPELSGRENIFLNGSILGMSRDEIEQQLDDIVEFAEINDFLDTPVKRYSSGMYVRLAFSVAAHLNPDILIVDEVLAVGDQAFQQKCLGKLKDTAQSGRTVLFVSHNMTAVKSLCSRIIYLKDGKIKYDGLPEEAISRYLAVDKSDDSTWIDTKNRHTYLKRVGLEFIDGTPSNTYQYTDNIVVNLQLEAMQIGQFKPAVRLTDIFGNVLFTSWDKDFLGERQKQSKEVLKCTIPPKLLKPGDYIVTAFVHIFDEDGNTAIEEVNLDLSISSEQCPIHSGRLGLLFPTLEWQVESP